MKSPLLLGEHVRVGPLARVLGEVEVLGRPVLALPAHEQLLVGGGGLDDPVEPRHHLVDVAVQEDLEGLVLGLAACRCVLWSGLAHVSPGGGLGLAHYYHSFNKYQAGPAGVTPRR